MARTAMEARRRGSDYNGGNCTLSPRSGPGALRGILDILIYLPLQKLFEMGIIIISIFRGGN